MSRHCGTAALLLAVLVMAGCTPPSVVDGDTDGTLGDAVSAGTAPFAILDLDAGTVRYAASLPDLTTNAAYKDGLMVFRRVGPEGARVLIGVFEVSQAQWQRLEGGAGPWPWDEPAVQEVVDGGRGDAYPAFNLSYDGIATVLANYAPAGSARLAVPTSAQWEAAVGRATGYAWGDAATRAQLVAQALVRETALDATNAAARMPTSPQLAAALVAYGGPNQVGALSAAPTGMYDIHGNVWEWTSTGSEVRGGSWYDAASLARAEVRAGTGEGLAPDVDHALIGVRLVLRP